MSQLMTAFEMKESYQKKENPFDLGLEKWARIRKFLQSCSTLMDFQMALEDHRSVWGRLLFLMAILFFLSGCAHVIPKKIIQQANTEITFAELQKTPSAYQGELILVGGVIVKTENRKEGTLLEVYQTEMSRMGEPEKLDVSEGRFVALYEGFLDNAIYRKGRKVTIAGIVQGEKSMRIGELDYRCPYLLVKHIHLWEKEELRSYEPYPWPRYPWWYPFSTWYDPYWHYR
jgi:outer membrane lipoprotein